MRYLFFLLIFKNISGFAIKHLTDCRKGGKADSRDLVIFDLGEINVGDSYTLGKLARHVEELLSCLDANNALKVAHHRERMGADNRADAVNSILILFTVCRKRRIDRFLESCESIC